MVGFNRRFSPFVQKIKGLLDQKASPKCFIFTMNAGYIPPQHWTQKTEKGGGRIVGEACHYIDLMLFLSGSSIKSWSAIGIDENNNVSVPDDRVAINIKFEDGSIGTINYLSNGGPFPKERIEVFCDNAVLQLDNFKKLKGYGWNGFRTMKSFTQDKGQKQCVLQFINAIKNKEKPPIPFAQIREVANISIEIANSLRT
jgi:predicted dehydrogenase